MDSPRARVARIARVAPHTIHTHTITQLPPRQPSRRRAARLGRSGSAEQRAIGGASEMRPAGSGFDRVLAGLTDLAAAGSRTGRASARVVQTARGPLRGTSSPSPAGPDGTPVGGSSSVAQPAVRRAAVDMSTATTTAACTRARAARALYTLQQGPRSTKRAPSTAIEFQRARLRVGKTAFTSTTMWRMFAARTGGPRALARSRRRARAAATSRVTGPVLAASSTSEMHCRSQWSRSGLSECNHVAVDGHHLMPV